MTDAAEVICGDRLYGCWCGLPPGHDGTLHECAEGDPQCGGTWRDHETDPSLVYIVRCPGFVVARTLDRSWLIQARTRR